jgi:hypothetical protein
LVCFFALIPIDRPQDVGDRRIVKRFHYGIEIERSRSSFAVLGEIDFNLSMKKDDRELDEQRFVECSALSGNGSVMLLERYQRESSHLGKPHCPPIT